MKGKILGLGAISGDDGKRYSFELSDIANLGQRKVQNLAGCEVDFVPSNDNAATEIFIIDSTFYSNVPQNISENINENHKNIDENIHSNINDNATINIDKNHSTIVMDSVTKNIRFKFLLSTWLFFIGWIFAIIAGFLGVDKAVEHMSFKPLSYQLAVCYFVALIVIPMVVGLIFLILATIGINRASESKSLIKKLIIFPVISTIIAIGISVVIGAMMGAVNSLVEIGLFVGLITTFVFYLLYMRELAFVTNQKILLWALYVNILGALTGVIGYVFLFAASIMQIIGFMKFQKIRKRSENDVMPWF